MASSNGAHHRERFQPWLIQQIDSNRYTGLAWLDDAHTMFRIPWKSFKQKDISDTDYAIFKAWAKRSGKYSQHEENPTRWKTNFRAAMRSIQVNGQKVFQQVRRVAGEPDPRDPYKVFEICRAGACQAAEDPLAAPITERRFHNNTPGSTLNRLTQAAPLLNSAAFSSGNSPEENSFYALEDTWDNLAASVYELVQRDFTHPQAAFPMQSPPGPSAVTNQPHHQVLGAPNIVRCSAPSELAWEALLGYGAAVGTGNSPEEMSFYLSSEQWANPVVSEGFPVQNDLPAPAAAHLQKHYPPSPLLHATVTNQPPNTAQSAAEAQCRKRLRSEDLRSAGDEPAPQDLLENRGMDGAGVGSGMQGPIQHAPPAESELGSLGDLLCCLELTVYYRGKEVLRQEMKHSRCLLNYNVEVPSLGPLRAVHFPSPDELPDQKQVELTRRVLEAIKRGLLLEVNRDEKKICATWLGRSCYKVFWASSEQLSRLTSSTEPECLEKKVETNIFNFKTFWTELEEYRNGRRRSPDFTIYLCFGQKFRVEKPKEDKLVLVKIVPRFCVLWYESVQQGGASSLNSELASMHINSGSNSLNQGVTFEDVRQAMEEAWL